MVNTIKISLFLFLSLLFNTFADPNLIYHFPFDEGQGTRTYPSSSETIYLQCFKKNVGDTISPVWLSGPQDSAIGFDSLTYVLYGGYGTELDPLHPRCKIIDSIEGITIAAWMRSPKDCIIFDSLDGTIGDTIPSYVGPHIEWGYTGGDSVSGTSGNFGYYGSRVGTFGRLHYDCRSHVDAPAPSNDYYSSKWQNTDNDWHHYAVTHNYLDSTINMYIDGVFDTSFKNPYAMDREFNRSEVYLVIIKPRGGWSGMPDSTLYSVDELYFFTRVLDSIELQDLANNSWLDTTIGDDSQSKRINDSLALVALYDSTGGNDWTNHTNWSTCEPIDNWYGVTVSNDRVTSLVLNNNNLGGVIPKEIGDLKKLETLNLSDNNISGKIPTEIGEITNLKYIYLYKNQLSDSLPSSIGDLDSLVYLYVQRNYLTGLVPTTLGSLTNLEILNLSYNNFSGQIPSSLGNATKLSALWLQENQFTDSLPSSLGSLNSLLYLYANYNQLSGAIPLELGNLSSLKELSLYANNFSDTIPSALGNLSNLEELYLYNNSLTGEVPSSFGSLSKLKWLYLKNNNLTSVGDSIVNLTSLLGLSINNNKICTVSSEIDSWLDNLQPGWEVSQDCP